MREHHLADAGTVQRQPAADPRHERLYGERTYVVHRADLLGTLKAAVPDAELTR